MKPGAPKDGAALFADRINAFFAEVQRRDHRSARLLGPRSDLEQDPSALRSALDELRFHHDALVSAEEELREQLDEIRLMGLSIESERLRYIDLFQAAHDAYFVTDRSGVIVDANAAAVALVGVGFPFLRGKPAATYISGEGGIHTTLATLVRTGKSVDALACTLMPRGGVRFPVVARLSLVTHESRVLWSVRRVLGKETERMQSLESRLAATEERLAREISARDEIQRISDAKDGYIAVLSQERSSKPPPRVQASATLAGTRVLVVDDESDARELIATILEHAEANVEWASGPAQALALCELGRFDVVVSEMSMPDIDGCDLIAELRARDPRLAAVAVSSHASEDETKRALVAGFDVHLAMPLDARELIAAVRAAAQARRR